MRSSIIPMMFSFDWSVLHSIGDLKLVLIQIFENFFSILWIETW
jgi:hypothetical protein